MSTLPPATKDISDNPSAGGVTQPTDKAFKAADEERKMRIYAVIQALREGKYPSNTQINETLKYVQKHSPIDEGKLSSDGRLLIEDVREIIETARVMVEQKNKDELFQNFLWHTRHIDADGHISNIKGLSENGPSGEDTKSDGQAAAENLRTLAKLIYTSSETRKLLRDVGILARDVAADAAVKAADTARPSEQQLAQVDEPGPDREWIGPDGTKYSHNEPVPDTGLAAKREEAKKSKARAQAAVEHAKSEGTSEARGAADAARAQAEDATNQVQSAQRASDAAADISREKQDIASGIASEKTGKIKNAYNNLIGKVPEEHRDTARRHREETKDYLREKFPQERRDRFIFRLKKVIVEQQSHRDFQDAVEFFLSLAETYKGHLKGSASSAGEKAGDIRGDAAWQQAESELRTLLERFANGSSMSPIFEALNQIYIDAQQDEGLKNWFKKLDGYVRRVLQEPGYVLNEQCDADGRAVMDDGKTFWSGKYKSHKDNLFGSIEAFFSAYADDPINVRFGQNWKQLINHLFLNAEGSLSLKPHLWQDITSIILPDLFKHIGYIPIPRIEYTDSQLDLVIENLTLESQNLLPNVIEVEMKNHFKLSAYNKIRNVSHHSFKIAFSQVQADLRDVAFYVRKKSGFPKLNDSGLADVQLSGKGVSGDIHIESNDRSGSVFTIKEVNIKVEKMAFALRDTKHSVLYNLVKPIASGLIKKQIARAIEDAIRSSLSQLDQQLVDIMERLEAAEGDDDVSKMDAIKEAFTVKKQEAAEVKSQKEPKGTFQIVSKRDSKLVDWSSPNSLVEKQGAAQDKAAKSPGVSWRSDAFNIIKPNA